MQGTKLGENICVPICPFFLMMSFLYILLSCTTYCNNTRRILFPSPSDDKHQIYHPKQAGCEHFTLKSGWWFTEKSSKMAAVRTH